MRLAILCPGQGAQHAGMFDLARSDTTLAAQIDAGRLPDGADLFANRSAQPLIVAAGCAMWQALHHRLPAPHAVVGYSVGEVTALAVAGVLSADAAIELAAARALAMDACVDPGLPQGLLAVSGLTMDKIAPFLATATGATTGAIYMAIENGADQCVLGGLADELAATQRLLEALGGKTQMLPVAVASHTPWMQGAVAAITSVFTKLARAHIDEGRQPRIVASDARTPAAPHGLASERLKTRLLSGVTADSIENVDQAINSLASQTVSTIRWSGCMDTLAEAGITAALELGPGSALSRMLANRHPHIACRSVADFRTLDGIASWVVRLP